MREIKFRGKRLDTGEWVYGSLCQIALTGETSIVDWDSPDYSRREVDPETVGQFTGMYDRIDVEIYEHDIFDGYEVLFGQCYINQGEYSTYGYYIDDPVREILDPPFAKMFAVTGNKFDNPELLEAKQ